MMREPKTVPIPKKYFVKTCIFDWITKKFQLLTSTGSSNTNGGSTGTNEFGGGIDIAVGNRDGEWSIKISMSTSYSEHIKSGKIKDKPDGNLSDTSWGGEDNSVHIFSLKSKNYETIEGMILGGLWMFKKLQKFSIRTGSLLVLTKYDIIKSTPSVQPTHILRILKMTQYWHEPKRW